MVDIGCGEGELLSCLCNPAPWLAPPPPDVLAGATAPSSSPDDIAGVALASLHRDVLHPVRLAGLDVSAADLECAARITQPPPPALAESRWGAPVRWEPLEVALWEGSLARVNEAFVGIECVVATEV